MKPKISVVIPAHNRPDFLEKTIKAIIAQSVKEFELLVVGFKGNNTVPVTEKKFSDKRIKFFRISSSFPDKKRNFGIKRARAPIVAFTDDDCQPEKNWLKEILKAFSSDRELAGVEGLTWNDNKKLFFHATENLHGGNFPACNYAFRKKWLEKVRGFDEEYNFFREDTDLAFKVMEAGGRIEFEEEVIVFHPPRVLPFYFPLKELKMVKGDVRLWKKFPGLHSEHFGFLCRGSFKQSAFSWLAFVLLFVSLSAGSIAFFALLASAVIVFKFFVEMKKKSFPPDEGLLFVLFSFFRDLLFPFYFAFYWITVRP